MRNPIPFDTHAYVKRLVAAGMPEAQAEVQAEALSEVILAQLATKDDLRQAVAELERKIDGVRSELGGEMREMRGEMRAMRGELGGEMRELELRLKAHIESELRKQILWFFTMQVALIGAVIAILKLV
jgi:hypothetical protein